MIFGIRIEPIMLEAGGMFLGLVVLFQVAAGARWIRLPRKYHLRVHRWAGYAILALAALHGFVGFVFFNGWTIG